MRTKWKTLLMFVMSAGVVGVIALLPAQHSEAAGIGCCMKRDKAIDGTPWYQFSTDIKECKRENRNPPDNNDNILEPMGRIWWNVQC